MLPTSSEESAGQFVIFRLDEQGERVPVSVAGWDREKGTVTVMVQAAGRTTKMLHIHEDPNPDCPIGQHIGDVLRPTFEDLEHQLLSALATRTLDDLITGLRRSADQNTQGPQ